MLLLLAGGLAALVQYLLPPSAPVSRGAETHAAAPPSPAPVRQILPIPQAARPAPPPSPAPVSPAPVSPPAAVSQAAAAAPSPAVTSSPVQLPVDAAVVPTPPASAAPQGEVEVAEARTTEGPAAIALVDLNSASVADLNRLRGGGSIGRAIVAKRPYTAVSDLLTKRVLSRSTFERIREQVTVR